MSTKSNRTVVLSCVAAVAAMGALTYAAVPLYQMFCQVTGFGGTTQRADAAPGVVLDRTVTVRFDSNVAKGLTWTFEPVQRTIDVKIGQEMLAFYRATNTSDKPVTGTASFNVSPESAGLHFKKVECFCFTEQTLQPGQSVEMPVSFFVDPEIVADNSAAWIREITLSYTFYPTDKPTAAAVGTGLGKKTGG